MVNPRSSPQKKVMGQVLDSLPADTEMGLMSYGINRKGDCTDIDLLSPIGANNAAAIARQVEAIVPKGDTPIAAALTQSADAFKGMSGQKMIVLVTDGAEACNGDPCAATRALAAADIDLHVNIVGFNLKDKARGAVQCIAQEGRGQYFDARTPPA